MCLSNPKWVQYFAETTVDFCYHAHVTLAQTHTWRKKQQHILGQPRHSNFFAHNRHAHAGWLRGLCHESCQQTLDVWTRWKAANATVRTFCRRWTFDNCVASGNETGAEMSRIDVRHQTFSRRYAPKPIVEMCNQMSGWFLSRVEKNE